MYKQLGLSPKLIADLFASVAGYVLAKYGAGLDPVASAAVGKAIGSVAAYIAHPGTVVIDDPDARVTPDTP